MADCSGKPRIRVFAALSGGVDSSVAAALLVQSGYEVVGGMGIMHNGMTDGPDVDAARSVASRLGIPFQLFDVRDAFRRHVIAPFCDSYWNGTTPSPCIECNRYVKFGALQDAMRELGCTVMATGHYARIERHVVDMPNADILLEASHASNAGRASNASHASSEGCTSNATDFPHTYYELHKAACVEKDQSYMLARLTQSQLSHTLFPLGSYSKNEVREIARELGFPTAERKESQDICFIPDGDYVRFVEEHTERQAQPGDFISPDGNVLGTHHGILRYTIGQRKGIGLAFGDPRYVCAIDARANTITIGTEENLLSSTITVRDFSWISGVTPSGPVPCKAKIRYRQNEQPATAFVRDDECVELHFEQPQRAVAPGQFAVLYANDGTRVLGAGVIAR